MSKVDIDVRFDGENGGGQTPRFQVNGQISGLVSIYPNENLRCRKLQIQLLWRTEGRGTRYQKVLSDETVFEGELRRGMPKSYNFSMSLPNEPWSYSGRYVSVAWGIMVKIDVPMGRDVEQFERFILTPQRMPDS